MAWKGLGDHGKMNLQNIGAIIPMCALLSFTAAMPSVGLGLPQASLGNVSVPTGEVGLGVVKFQRRIIANEQALESGTYELLLTADPVSPVAPGTLVILERWVEFRQNDEVKGREVVSMVPQSKIDSIAKSKPPGSGDTRVETLKGSEYLRVWVNQSDTHYLIHLVVG